MTTRRDFLRSSLAAGGALVAGGSLAACAKRMQASSGATAAAPKKPNLLVLGGTGFIGPHIVRHAVARGHAVTIFTRGRHDAELPAGVARLQGDRKDNLTALEGKTWDAVIDDSATNPDWVQKSTALLKGKAGRYLFTSSTGALYPYTVRGMDESSPAHTELADPKDFSEVYGTNKAKCERLVLDAFGDGGTVVRPTYIVGPGDTTDRFPYWPQRLAKGGETLAPGPKSDPVQLIDVRDLAEFMVHLVETGQGGIYDAAGPAEPLTIEGFLTQAKAALGSTSTFTWIEDHEFLAKHEIYDSIPWALLEGPNYGMMSIRNDKAKAAGLRFRPLATTVRDTLAWWRTVPEARRAAPKFSLTPEKEAKALADWHALGR